MEEIKSWALSVCCAAVTGTIINMILPEGSLQRMYKYIFSIFFLCTVLSPLSEVNFSYYFDLNNFTLNIYDPEYNEIYDSNEKYLTEKISSSVEDILSSNGINYENISIKINISEEGSIDINKFELTIKNPGDTAKVKNLILNNIGAEPEIIYSGETKDG